MSGKTRDVEYRRQQIMKLGYLIQVRPTCPVTRYLASEHLHGIHAQLV